MKAPGFRIIIVGGGIGGLALANSLQEANIEYILIEKGKELDPQIGASIGILPNGARILDQLGCGHDLTSLTVGMETTATHRADGSLIGHVSDSLMLMQQRTGYAVIFLDRQLLLRTLARRIKDQHRIRLNTVVERIEQYEDKAIVQCADGTEVEGDLVVGADGVHSLVRREMWRHADDVSEGEMFDDDRNAMSAEYKCLFGISESLPGMQPGQTDRTYAHNLSTLSYVGKGGRVFWFVFVKMDKVYYPPDIPKFTSKDTTELIEEIGHVALREAGKVTVADVFRANVCCNLVAIEEAAYRHWSYGRLVCLGDAIHKMTPNLGAGASSAIESAAILSNVLVKAVSASSKPSLTDIQKHLKEYQAERSLRVGRAMATTNKLTRVQALQTKMHYIFTHYIAPRADDYYAEAFSNFVIGAPVIEHLPIPERSLRGTMPFNPKQGWGFEEPVSARAKRAWPLVMITILSLASSFDLLTRIPQLTFVQRILTDQGQNSASRSFASSISAYATYGLWLLESTRLNNKSTLAQIPILFGICWLSLGQASAVSMYFFLLYVCSPIEKFRAADNRLTDVSYTYTVGPLLFLLGAVPASLEYAMSLSSAQKDHEYLLHGLQLSRSLLPISIAILQLLFATFVRRSTIRSDRLWDVRRDCLPIRCTTALLAGISAIAWVAHLIRSSNILGHTSYNSHLLQANTAGKLAPYCGNETVLIASGTVWLGLALSDLRRAGMLEAGYTRMGATWMITLICLGPGAMLVSGWQWREEILIHRKHRDAVVPKPPTATPIKLG